MKKLIIFINIYVLILLLAIPAALTFAIKFIPNDIQPSLGNTKKIYGDFVFSQEFLSSDDNFSGIGVSIKNPNFANRKNVYVSIYDSENKLLRSATLNGQNIADGKFVKIIFEPIPDSANHKYTWNIASADSIFEDALELFLTADKPFWSLDFKVNGKPEGETLSYVLFHRISYPTEVLEKVYSGWVNNLVADLPFFAFYLTTVLTLTGLLIFLKFSKSQQRNLKIL